jgi:hypothetical protein
MSDEVKNFIDKIADGDNTAAGDAFKDALRVKVGDALDAHRQEVAGNLFNGTFEAQPHSDPKPEIADPGTFNQDGSVSSVTGNDGEAQIDLTQGTEDAGQ